jgi:hypothetical protein
MMAWWPGKNIGRPQGGWLGAGRARQKELKERGMNTPAPQYDQGLATGFGQAATTGAGAADYGREGMQEAMGMYRDMAAGNGPSVAEQQLQRGADQAIVNQTAMQAGGTAGNLGSAMRGASAAGAGMGMQANAEAAQLRAAEQQQAMAGLGGLSQAYTQGGLAQQQGAMGLQGQMGAGQLAADTEWGLGQRGLDIEQLQGNRGFGLGVVEGVSNIAKTVGGLAMLSDERAKTAAAPSGGAATEAARAANPISFDYKPGMGPPGRRAGVTAQGLAATPAGQATLAGSDPQTGMMQVDPGQLSALSMAGTAETVQRMDRLEAMLQAFRKQKKTEAV